LPRPEGLRVECLTEYQIEELRREMRERQDAQLRGAVARLIERIRALVRNLIEQLARRQEWREGEATRITAILADTRVIEDAMRTYTAFDFPLDARAVEWRGRGGTDLAPAIARAASLRPCCLVVVSDMEWDYEDVADPGVPTLWIDTAEPNESRPRFGLYLTTQAEVRR